MIEARVVTAEDYHDDPDARAFADRLLVALDLDPKKVTRLSVTEGRVTVHVIDRHPRSGALTIREIHYDLPRERTWPPPPPPT